ncbi:MAG: aminoacyl-tRNA hydrolase [Candidatus Marinimicrobia bacterium]|nr:aminoacyl-tRNA hydrolase [Candidatus Neomarinimicrobiota bacterium]|tara:strand:- start:341 stop:760 length:420 start_codon:yes stop_codon:yes gene_type:complete
MIQIYNNIFINEGMIKYKGIRSAKPGGQNVNKVSTGIHLQYDLNKHGYPSWFIAKIKENGKKSISESGILNIKAISHRTQYRNRQEALKRMVDLFNKSVIRPKKRIKTRPSLKSHVNRIASKKKQSQKKQLRKPPKINE